jgi:photosystem II stability/assembly factor-like uncharacterized protein
VRKRTVIAVSFVVLVVACIGAALSSAVVTTSHSGWTWGNPRPQGNTLQAVEFAGADGYAVGAFGTIIRTTDGGNTWTGVRTGTSVALSKLRVLDSDTFLAGAGCTLLRSDDGGQTVAPLRFAASNQCGSPLASFHFVNSNVGYLLRTDGSVLRTDDGGQRFAARTSVPTSGGAPGPPNDIWFTGADRGFVVTGADVAGKVYRTTNGGGTWDDVKSARGLKSLFFTDASKGYAVGDNTVLKTTDGGDTWNAQPDPSAVLNRVRCADEQHCVVVTNQNQVMYTNDGFATLNPSTQVGGPAESRVPGNAAAYSSSTRAVSVGDGGDTWTSDDGGLAFDRGYLSVGFTYNRVRSTSAAVAYAPGQGGNVAKTTDGGDSWSNVGVPTPNGIVDVAFPLAAVGYAADTSGSMFRTDNGGDSWQILGQPGPNNPAALWASPTGGTVLFVGPFGILRSTDGGQHFDQVPGKLGSKSSYTDVDRVGGGTVVAFGSKVIALSVNAGQKWKSVKRPGKKLKILEVDFLNANKGYALTSDGRLWRTANHGKRWKEVLAVGTNGAYALSFGDVKHGWLAVSSFAGTARNQGWLLRTSDGGQTWRPQLIDSREVNMDGVEATSDTTGFALTDGNLFFATRSGGDSGSASSISIKAKGQPKKRIKAGGKLTPPVAGAKVAVFARDSKSKAWSQVLVTTDSKGRFTTLWKVKRLTFFVSRWVGNQAFNGAGSKVAKGKPKPATPKP